MRPIVSYILVSVLLSVSQTQGKNLKHKGAKLLLSSYSCEGKESGYYPDLERCSHYVYCEEDQAYEMECGEKQDEFGNLQKLHFVAESGPDPASAYCDFPVIAGCDPVTPPPPDCDEGDCQLKGYCRDYNKCEKGHWKKLVCGADLFWDPTVSWAHGGVCNYFDNLSPATQKEYLDDLDCIEPCYWWQTPAQECSAKYMYRSKFTGSTEDREQELQCPNSPVGKPKLCWSNNERLTCVRCSEAVDLNGQPCQTQIA